MDLLTITEASKFLSISRHYLEKLMKRYHVPHSLKIVAINTTISDYDHKRRVKAVQKQHLEHLLVRLRGETA